MTTNTIKPENLGKVAILQIIQSKGIILKAEQQAKDIMETCLTEKEETIKKAYHEGLLLGAEKAHLALHNSTQVNAYLKTKLEQIILDLTKQVLSEVVQEDINDTLKNTLAKRINSELEAYSKQVNLDETKITLEISPHTEETELNKIRGKYPFLNILKSKEIDTNAFILRSPYGEIESDPMEYVNLISDHLQNSFDLGQALFSGDQHEQL